MKLLFDENLSDRLCSRLAGLFPESAHVKHVGLRHTDDIIIWQYALDLGYVVVSQDADFRDIARRSGPPPQIVLIRTGNTATTVVERLLRERFAAIVAFGDTSDAILILS